MMVSMKCNQEVYDKGETVFLTHTLSSGDMEDWTITIAKESGQNVDWHWGCGRAEMLAVGDLSLVRKAIIKFRDIHDRAYAAVCHDLGFDDDHIRRHLEGIWEYNRVTNGLSE